MPYAPGQTTGYVSVGDYLGANQDTLGREAGQITSDIGGQYDAAKQAAGGAGGWFPSSDGDYTTSPGYTDALGKVTAAQDQATALGTHGGMTDYFSKHFGDSAPQASFDANLLGASGKLDTNALASQAGTLTDYLNNSAQTVHTPSIPGGQQRNPIAGTGGPPNATYDPYNPADPQTYGSNSTLRRR